MIKEDFKSDELLTIRSDIVFHYLLNSENMSAIEWLVMHILNYKYEDVHNKVTIQNIRIGTLAINNTQKYLDLIVNLEDDVLIIELNNHFDGNYTRNVIYAMNGIVNQYVREMDGIINSKDLVRKDIYKTKRVRGILVNLNWIDKKNIKTPKIEEQVLGYPILGEEKDDYILKIINVNLYKYRNLCYNEINEEEKVWKLFTIHRMNELENYRDESLLTRYFDTLKNISSDEEAKKMVWTKEMDDYFWETTHNAAIREQAMKDGLAEGRAKGMAQGRAQGRAEGRAEGENKKQREMIINMHNKNIPIETIAECSNLSQEKVLEIINDNS